MPNDNWIPIAKFALDNHVSRPHIYRSIRRGDVEKKYWKLDDNQQFVIRTDAPVPPKRGAGRKAEIKKP